jgi:hypothetical protein
MAATTVKNSWRTFFKVHPAADVFPLMSEDELRALAKDIERHGLKIPVEMRRVVESSGEVDDFVIDGRNRLDAMEKVLGWRLVNDNGDWSAKIEPHAQQVATHRLVAGEVIGYNARRQLTKQELVKCIDAALKAGEAAEGMITKAAKSATDDAIIARSVKRDEQTGQLRGSTKDEHRAAVLKEAAKHNISKRTVELALAKERKKREWQRLGPQERKREVADTSTKAVDKKFSRFLRTWPITKHRLIKARVVQHLLGRWDRDNRDATGMPKFIAPVSVKYTDGKTQTIAEMFQDWQPVLDKP